MNLKLRDTVRGPTTLAYRRPPLSGNIINGLGETECRRASHVFHNEGDEELPWDLLDRLFSYMNNWRVVLHIFRNTWNLRKATGPVSPVRREIKNALAMTEEIKRRARRMGADFVGATSMRPDYVFENREVPYRWVVCLGIAMNPSRMKGVPDNTSAVEVMRAYAKAGRIAARLSEEIRDMGWPAQAYGNPNSGDFLHIPAAMDCGLGQLGKHGSLISREYGSNFRLAAVVTDLPLVSDRPVDIGVDDLCSHCNLCVRKCPVDAIYDDKQMVRGLEKWYVDFDRCIYYFCETGGCGICIEVCPWNDRGEWLSRKLLAKRMSLGGKP